MKQIVFAALAAVALAVKQNIGQQEAEMVGTDSSSWAPTYTDDNSIDMGKATGYNSQKESISYSVDNYDALQANI